jgi:hypothetical protein
MTNILADFLPDTDLAGLGKPFLCTIPLSRYSGVLSTVLQISNEVSADKGVILGSLLKRLFTSTSGAFVITGITTPLFHTNFFPDLMQVYVIPDEVLV